MLEIGWNGVFWLLVDPFSHVLEQKSIFLQTCLFMAREPNWQPLDQSKSQAAMLTLPTAKILSGKNAWDMIVSHLKK